MKTKLKRSARRSKLRRPRAAARITRQPAAIELKSAALSLRSILVPVDFSGESMKALKYAVSLAHQYGAKITLLNVVEPTGYPDFAYFPLTMENEKVMKSARGQLDLLCKREAIDPKLMERTLVRHGVPFHEITDAARTLKSDLIIIATHGYTGVKHALIGSTAERVVRHAPCPVLSVRETERDFLPTPVS